MLIIQSFFILTTMLLVFGCAGYAPIKPHASQVEVKNAWGKPSAMISVDNGERWVYSMAPEGHEIWLLNFDQTGHLSEKVQALTSKRIAQVTPGMTQSSVEALIGPSFWSFCAIHLNKNMFIAI